MRVVWTSATTHIEMAVDRCYRLHAIGYRAGRSLPDLIASMQGLHGAKVDLFIHQQGLDTTTASGRATFEMLSVFSEFERAVI